MRTQTISQRSGMDVRPHSRPERTGPYMTGIVIDCGIGHSERSRDIGPDTDGKGDLQRLKKQARSTTQGRQAESEGSPRTIRTAAGYSTLDTSYTPFLQPVWCETQIFRHVDT